MARADLEKFLGRARKEMPFGAVALVFAEDEVGLGATVRHHARIGFRNIVLLAPPELPLPADCAELCHRVDFDLAQDLPLHEALNLAIAALPGRWIYYCYNAEFLHFPFCETRSIEEFTAFLAEERRRSAFTYVVDLYSNDLEAHPLGYSLESAHFDAAGYYALTRWTENGPAERQVSIYGGLKWRFEEHLPYQKRRIDRVSLFRAEKGLTMDADHYLSDEELNTYQCPWHHSPTVAVCSFRTAKYLKANPGSTFEIASFNWPFSRKFHWNSQQLMDLGLMEPGQWF